MESSHHPKQSNTDQARAKIEGETLDTVMAQFLFETLVYAQSFANRTWHPSRRTLFQVANQFPQN